MWQTPKTNWKIQPPGPGGTYNGDWFNIEDYERICQNITYLHALGSRLYHPFALLPMPPQTPDAPCVYASVLNAVEQNLALLALHTVRPPGFAAAKTWQAGGFGPTVDDLNRIEGGCLLLHAHLARQAAALAKLPFGMGKGPGPGG